MSESSGEPRVLVTRRGATIQRAGDMPLLLAAADLPDGGMIALDLDRPSEIALLFLTSSHWAVLDEFADDEKALAVRLEARVAQAALPPAWLRLAFVTGLARWYPDRLDEDLLAVDLASALAAAGWQEEAEAYWRRGRERAMSLLGESLAAATHGELSRALDLLEPGVHVLQTPAKQSARVAQARGGRHLSAVPAVRDPRRPYLDPRNLPSRTLTGQTTANVRGEAVVVDCTAYDDGDVSDALHLALYEGGPDAPRRVATVPLVHTGQSYRAELHGAVAEGWRAGAITIEVRSAASPHGPLLDDTRAQAVVDLQAAFAQRRQTMRRASDAGSGHTRLTLAELGG